MKTLVIAVNTSGFFWSHRLYMAEQAKARGFRVVVLAPPVDETEFQRYRKAGYEHRAIEISRHGINPFADWKTIRSFKKQMSDLHVDIFHGFTVKCNIYGGFAAAQLKVPTIIATITGMGIPYANDSRKSRFIRWAIRRLYLKYLPKYATVIFQNETDKAFFENEGYLQGQRTLLIPGNGIDLERFSPVERPQRVPRILFPARLVFEKGIRETMAAAEQLHNEGEKFELWICGKNEDDASGHVPPEVREKWKALPFVKWLGFQEGMHKVYQNVDIVCLPSYREGLSQSLIEAAGCGLPAVTTDVPGCRDVVIDGETGCLVPAQSWESLVEPLRNLIHSSELREQLGTRAREVAVERYDRKKIVSLFLNLYISAIEASTLGSSRLFKKRAS